MPNAGTYYVEAVTYDVVCQKWWFLSLVIRQPYHFCCLTDTNQYHVLIVLCTTNAPHYAVINPDN
jgi:hypothetical protein